ncbi:putative Ig domain-containing protein [Tahibacter sp. UC22_41]|uniref:putative Ig domain-containing protein n=1 Tax=Tahibacter sp. UC22_41 TaxID=3350178 RepID=UPI0036DF77EA
MVMFKTPARAGRAPFVGRAIALALGCWQALPAAAQVQRTFVNLGFEQPSAGSSSCYFQVSEAIVPGWTTNHPSQNGAGCSPNVAQTPGPLIEIWANSFNSVPARAGTQFAELNAEAASRIYQNVCLANGELVGWRFSHRGRQSASTDDVTEFRVGASAGTNRVVRAGTQNDGGGGVVTCYGSGGADGDVANNSCTSSLATNGWRDYSGEFTWQGSTATQAIGFEAVSAAGGSTIGNFIDDIQMTLRPFVELTTASASVREGGSEALPALRVVGTVPTGGLTVELAVQGAGTATRGTDYTTTSGTATLTVTVPAGVYDGTDFALPLSLIDDSLIEDNETIVLAITSSPTNYVLSSTQTCGGTPITTTTITVRDDDVDLTSALSASAASALGGEALSYTWSVGNHTAAPTVGDVTARDAAAAIAFTPPAGLSFTGWTCTATGGARCPGGTVNGMTSGSGAISGTANLPAGNATAGGQLSYAISAAIDPTRCSSTTATASVNPPGSLSEGTAVQAGFVSPTPGGSSDNSASHTVSLSCLGVLSVVKSDGSATYTPGGSATYQIDVTNAGPSTATALQISDALPTGVTLSGAPTCTASGGATCGSTSGTSGGSSAGLTGATLPPGSGPALRLSVPVTFAGSLNAASVVNLAQASSAVSPMASGADTNARTNQAPVATAASVTVGSGGSVAITLAGTDADGDALTYTITTAPTHGTLSGTAPNLTYTPSAGYAGSDSLAFTVNDGFTSSAPATVTITVTQTNRAPVITSPPVTQATTESAYRYDVIASDPDVGDVLGYTLPLAPTGMTVNATSGRIDWTADPTMADGVALPNTQCRLPPVVPAALPFTAAQVWRKTPGVIHTPIVARIVDTNSDGVLTAADHPAVIAAQGGRLVVRDGVTGNVLWQSATLEFASYGATPAVGDTDGDGWPEIYLYVGTSQVVASFSAQGVERWRSPGAASNQPRASITLADLDGDGVAEVLADTRVLNSSTGAVKWTDSGGFTGAIPVAVDLDGDGTQEVLMGKRALNANGTLRWSFTHPSVNAFDTHLRWAVGQLDADASPELAMTAANAVYVVEHDGTLKAGFPIVFTGDTNASNPALGDVDGDGKTDIVVATMTTLYALRADGSPIWETISDDGSSFATPSVFDFDGDNRAEVVFAGHSSVRVLDGRTGAERLKYPIQSSTYVENATIADVDGDGHADLVFGDDTALTVIRDAQNRWVGTRSLWNQHAYTVSGISEAGRVPASPVPSWLAGSLFRGNAPPVGHPLGQPDLVLLGLHEVRDSLGTRLVVRARNRGLAISGATAVRFYDGDPTAGGTLLGETAVPALAVNAETDVTLELAPGVDPGVRLVARIDEAASVTECLETNNTAQAARVRVRVADVAGLFDTQTYTLNVTTANRAPQWVTTGLPDVRVGEAYAVTLQTSDADVGDAVRYTRVSGPEGSDVDDLRGRFVWTPTPAQVGTVTVVLRATDLAGAYVDRSFSLTVIPNQLPVFTQLPPGSALAGQGYSGTVAASDPDGDPLSLTLNRAPTGMTMTPAGVFAWTPTTLQVGHHVVRVTATDDHGGATVAEWIVSVERAGHAPVFTSTPVTVATKGKNYRYAVTASDADGDTLTYSLAQFPSWGMTINASTGVISWPTVELGPGVSYAVTVRVDDSHGNLVEQKYLIEIRAAGSANRAPQFSSAPVLAARVGKPYRYPAQVSDPDGDALTYTLPQAPTGMAVDAAGVVTWTPGATGAETVTLRAADAALYTEQGWRVDVVAATAPIEVQVSLTPSAPLPGTPVQVQVTTTESGLTPVVTATLDGQPITLGLGMTTVTAPTTPGAHTLVVTLTDGVAVGTVTTPFGVVDVTDQAAPVVVIAAPVDDSVVTAPAAVTGTVSDANLLSWFLAVRQANNPGAPTTVIARGTGAVSNAALGTFDPTLLMNGQYVLILQAVDASGRTSVANRVVTVEGEMKVGHFSVTFEDVSLPLAGIPIRILRTYDTRRRNESLDFGYGWSVDYQNVFVSESQKAGYGWQVLRSGSGVNLKYCVLSGGSRRVAVTLPDGTIERFVAKASPECSSLVPSAYVSLVYEPESGTTSTLTQLSYGALRVGTIAGESLSHLLDPGDANLPADPNSYRLTTREGVVYDISQSTGVTRIQEPTGKTLTYSATGITHSSGTSVRFVRDGRNRIQRIVLPDGNEVSYDYGPDGDLIAAHDTLRQATRFAYKPRWPHYLEDLTDARGIRVQRNEYDDDGRLVATIDAEGHRVEYTHLIAERIERVKNRRGYTTAYVYDESGRILSETNALNQTTAHTYDPVSGEELTRTDALGHTTTWTYDAYGNRLSEKNALNQLTRHTYNAKNAQLQTFSAVDPNRAVTTNVYDPTWNTLQTTKNAANQTTTLGYDRNTATNTGELASLQDAGGATTTFTYNPLGWMIRQNDARGTATGYTHTATGEVLSETTTRTDNGSAVTLTTSYVRDAKGRITSTTYPDTTVTTATYTAADQPATQCDAQNRCTTFTYDDRGQLTTTTYPNGTFETKTYDTNGNVVAETGTDGRTTKTVFDALDRVVETIHPDATPLTDADNPRTTNQYDAAGRLEAVMDENGHVTTYGYDAADRQTSVTNALLQTTTTAYNADGQRISTTDHLNRTTTFVYDLAGRLIETIHPDAVSDDGNDANNPRTLITYDAAGRKVAETDESGRITRFAYDSLGRLIAVFLPNPATGANPVYTQSGSNPPTSSDSGVLITRYRYDEQGNKLEQEDASGRITRWRYDNAGRVLTRTLPLLQQESFVYDTLGRKISSTDFRGRTTNYTYQANTDWLATIDYATQADVSLSYTTGGELDTVTDGNGTTRYERDSRGRLTTVTWPLRPGTVVAPSVSYQYDAVGNRTKLTTQNQIIDYTFDDLNRLATVKPSTSSTPIATYGYDGVGNRASVTHDNGVTTSYSYNRRNRLTGIQHKLGATVLLGLAYTLDASGLRTGIAESGQVNRTVTYAYDGIKRLSSESVVQLGNDRRTSWTYDKTGNRLTQTKQLGPSGSPTGTASTAYVYDANDRLDTETLSLSGTVPGAAAGTTTYTYDAAGNTTKKVSPTETVDYVYDDANRLAELQTLAGDVTRYAYAHDGTRLSQTSDATGANPVTTHYLVDPNTAYAQVIEEAEQQGSGTPTLKALYAIGDDRIRRYTPAVAGSGGGPSIPAGLRYYHADGLGSTRLLTDDTAAITDHLTYEAFGEVDAAASAQTSGP